MMNIRNLRRAINNIADAYSELHDAIKEDLPVGCTVVYHHGKNRIYAEVIELPRFGERIKVRGRSGREYWIEATRVIDKVAVQP